MKKYSFSGFLYFAWANRGEGEMQVFIKAE